MKVIKIFLITYFTSFRVDDDIHIKVSDFGLAKDVYEEGHYQAKEQSEAAPIRWMSIEAIQISVFTTASDVVLHTFTFLI